MKTTQRHYRELLAKLSNGVANHSRKSVKAVRHSKTLDTIAMRSVKRQGQLLSGLGESSLIDEETLETLKSGSLIPDEVGGWSTKTVLAGLVILLALKARMKG